MTAATPVRRKTKLPAKSDASRWGVLVSRDRRAAGQFVYAVRTTGIYCRPGCGSRLPRRENVVFFDTPRAAAIAGFRACKRCRPDEQSAPDPHADMIETVCAMIADAECVPTLRDLARAAGISPHHLHRRFKAAMGITPKAFVDAELARRVRSNLMGGADITTAIHEAGYGSSSRFYERGQERLGMTAGQFKRGGRNADIQYATAACSLGRVLVAATDRGICAIQFGDDDDALVGDLKAVFPNASLSAAGRAFGALIDDVVAAVDVPQRALSLPLDLRGTAFQERVWQALRDIPAGQTATYSQVAQRIGQPTATRAVAGACASNKVSLAVPCHRVVRTDGGLGGYRWGVERKKALLKREAE